MTLIGWAFQGIIVGAAGTEFLRKKKPELVEKVEGSVKRVAGVFCSAKSIDDKAAQ